MQLQLNYEGEQYIIGIPLRDKPRMFSHYIIDADILDWVPLKEGNITAFATLAQARQAIDDLKGKKWFRDNEHPTVYKVTITRVDNGE